MLVDLLFHELRASPPGGSNLKNCSQRHRAKTKTRRFEPVASYCRAFRDLELYKPQWHYRLVAFPLNRTSLHPLGIQSARSTWLLFSLPFWPATLGYFHHRALTSLCAFKGEEDRDFGKKDREKNGKISGQVATFAYPFLLSVSLLRSSRQVIFVFPSLDLLVADIDKRGGGFLLRRHRRLFPLFIRFLLSVAITSMLLRWIRERMTSKRRHEKSFIYSYKFWILQL